MDLFDDPRLTSVGLLFEASNGMLAKLRPVFERHGLSGLDSNALMRLSRSPRRRLRMTDLATQTELSTSGVTRLVDRLERGGLVRRELDPADRRSAYAVLTAEGERRLANLLPEYLDCVDRWFVDLFTEDQLADLVAKLRRIRDAANPEAVAGVD
ncbi:MULTISPECIES: MarR family winged helix-turn-helix transcriptional regulator [unclassified Nocardia]|uniref:MarR family winged helix-turn-helix transcriptional regulator n=1 Tax=unclassified Nocardia TaxID=2637762 RepID=UPI001CE3C751|nr:MULTISPECIES: MarR family transcriptional regulator [unclassified Nocardia]